MSDFVPDRDLRDEFHAAWTRIEGPQLARCACGIAHGVVGIDAEADEIRRLEDRVQKLQVQLATCTCYDGNPENYEGFRADCPIHGAIRAFNEASRELVRVRHLLGRARTLIVEAANWVEYSPEWHDAVNSFLAEIDLAKEEK